MGERPQQTINPTAFALQAGKSSVPVKKKAPVVVSSQAPMQSSLQPQPLQSQAPTVATPSPVVTPKIWGIAPTFGATNINAQPTLWGATAPELGKQQQIINNQPKVPAILPETGVDKTAPENTDINTAISQLWADIKNWATLQQIKESYPEFSKLDDSVLSELGTDITNWASLDEIIAAYPEIQENKSFDLGQTLKDIGKWVAATVVGLGASKVVGETLQWIGKKVYGLTLPPTADESRAIQSYRAGNTSVKPRTTIDTAIESPLFRKWNTFKDPQINLWMFWSKSWIGVQAASEGQKLFEKNINPIFQKANEAWTTFDYKDLIADAKNNVNAAKDLSKEEKKSIIEHIDEVASDYKWSTTLENLDLAKKDLANKLPKKYYAGGKMTQTLKDAQAYLADAFRSKVHGHIEENYWVNSAKIYKDYANYQNLAKAGQKSMSAAGTEGAGGIIKYVIGEATTPVATTLGKAAYKLGGAVKALPDALVKWASKWLKAMVKGGKVFTMLEDWTLIPWSSSNIASKAINTPEKERVYLKWGDGLRVPKEKFKYDEKLKRKIYQTDLGTIDEDGNLIS